MFLLLILPALALAASLPTSAATDTPNADVRPVVRDGRGICAVYGDSGDTLVTDAWHNVIWRRTFDNEYTAFAGAANGLGATLRDVGGFKDGALEAARFNRPWGVIRYNGGYAVADTGNNAVRFIKNGKVTTLLQGKEIDRPAGLAADGSGNLYVSLIGKNSVLKIDINMKTSAIGGGFLEPTGLCFDGGLLYVCDSGNNRVVSVNAEGKTTVVAEGLNIPQGVLAQGDKIYISETGGGEVIALSGQTRAALAPNREIRSPRDLLILNGTLLFADEYGVRYIPPEKPAPQTFIDVDANNKHARAVAWAAENKYMVGMGGGLFMPDLNMTRAMALTVLAHMAGADVSGGGTWYGAAAEWAVKRGISDGARLTEDITRREFAEALYRYSNAGTPGYSDKTALEWAKAAGIMDGRLESETLTRGEAAAVLQRWATVTLSSRTSP